MRKTLGQDSGRQNHRFHRPSRSEISLQIALGLSVPATTTSATAATTAETTFSTAAPASTTATETTFASTATASTAKAAATLTAASPTTAAAKTASATAAAVSATTLAFLLRPCFIDIEGSALQILAVQAINGSLPCFFGRHFDKSEAFGSAAEFIIDDADRINLAEFAKGLPQIIFLHII